MVSATRQSGASAEFPSGAPAGRHCDPGDGPFALLDDRDATPERPTSRLYTGFEREYRCSDPMLLDALWAQVDESLRGGLHALVLADYEWGARLLQAGHQALNPADAPSLRVLLFRGLRSLSRGAADDWLQALDAEQQARAIVPDAAGVIDLEPSVDRAEFTQAIGRIHEAIRAGETYQVNYTYRLHGQAYGTPVRLYCKLRALQPVRSVHSSGCLKTRIHPPTPALRRMCCRAPPSCSCATRRAC